MAKLPLVGRLFESAPADRAALELARAQLGAELGADPAGAVSRYEQLVANFDAQREAAAQAVFGLGEAYRHMKRFAEARVQYARILREFVDFPELSRLSQRQLALMSSMTGESETRAANPVSNSPGVANVPAPDTWREERNLVMQELELLQEELNLAKERVAKNLEPASSTLPLQREMLRLKQQLLRFPREAGQGGGKDPLAGEDHSHVHDDTPEGGARNYRPRPK